MTTVLQASHYSVCCSCNRVYVVSIWQAGFIGSWRSADISIYLPGYKRILTLSGEKRLPEIVAKHESTEGREASTDPHV